MLYLYLFLLIVRAHIDFKLFFMRELVVTFFRVAYAANTGFNGLSIGFPYFTNVVQLLCSLSGWLHLNCSCRIAHNLGILLMNSNCFATFFQQHYSYVCSDIYYVLVRA